MIKRLVRVSPLQLGKVLGLTYGLMSLLFLPLFAVFMVIGSLAGARGHAGPPPFAVLAMAGSANHLANTMLDFPNRSTLGTGEALIAVIRIIGGLLIPLGLIYLTRLLWRQTRS